MPLYEYIETSTLFLYDAVPPVLHNFLPKYYLLPRFTLIFKGSCVTQGGTASYKNKLKSLYIFLQRNALIDIKISIIDICYTNMAPIPKTVMFSLHHEWNINKNSKLEKLTNML